MTLTQITLFFGLILFGLVCAMFIHSWLDKRGIVQNLRKLTVECSGQVIQAHLLVYPHFSGSVGLRTLVVFFTVVKVGRKHILYMVYHLASTPQVDFLLIQSGVYKPLVQSASAVSAPGETPFSETIGARLPDLDSRYEIRSSRPESARLFFEQNGIGKHLDALSEFTSLQLGPDALVVGKPYDGLSDTAPENIMRNVRALSTLAAALECPTHGSFDDDGSLCAVTDAKRS